MMPHDVSWGLVVYLISHDVSWGLVVYLISHGVSWGLVVYLISHGVSGCLLMSHSVSQRLMVFNDASLCDTVRHTS